MKAIQAEAGQESGETRIKEGAVQEEWPAVCRRFNDDVERVCDIHDIDGYTGLYRCFDDDNQAVYYLVSEDRRLFQMRRKHFLENIGYKKGQTPE